MNLPRWKGPFSRSTVLLAVPATALYVVIFFFSLGKISLGTQCTSADGPNVQVRSSAFGSVQGRAPVYDASGLRNKHALHHPSSIEVLASATQSIADLVTAGGVYIYDSDKLLQSVGGRPHFYRSGGPREGWYRSYDQYSLELTFIRYLQASPYLTDDPSKAKLFIVPQYSLHEGHWCTLIDKLPLKECFANVTRDYLMPLINAVSQQPQWQRNGGKDHVWVFPWDKAWAYFPGVPEALANCSYLGYYLDGDAAVIVPVPVPQSWSAAETTQSWLQGGGQTEHLESHLRKPALRDLDIPCVEVPKMSYLASFFGTVHEDRAYSHGIRQDLHTIFGGEGGTAVSQRVRWNKGHVPADQYSAALKQSIFCLSPPGWTPWSQRLYAALSAGCIPVFFESSGFNMWLPFANSVPWSAFTVTIPEGKHMDLVAILEAIPAAEVCRLRTELAHWAPFLMWSSSPDLTLLFTMREVWERVRPLAAVT